MRNCNEVIQGLPEVISRPAPANGALPSPGSVGSYAPLPIERYLREGCYLLSYLESPDGPRSVGGGYRYYGTLRVDQQLFGTIASGDLYFHQTGGRTPIPTDPNPGAGIPIFPIEQYTYYLRVTNILHGRTTEDHFTLSFEQYRYDPSTENWSNLGTLRAEMYWRPAPASYPSDDFYLVGNVLNETGNFVGWLSMGWVDSSFRKATVEIDRVGVSEFPGGNGDGVDWESIFEALNWEIDVVESEIDLGQPSGSSWSNAELHRAMLNERDRSALDAEWRYHLFAVRLLDATSRGVMYDAGGTDSNEVPREGAAISSHWVIPDNPVWGSARGLRFGEATGPYFRTAVHEVGHAMGLIHNSSNNGFMNTTPTIAAAGAGAFPANIQWGFHRDDARRLNHSPDICVRPGGSFWGRCTFASAPISPFIRSWPSGLEFEVKPLLEVVPIGAPVRVNITLKNTSDTPVEVPKSLSLAASSVQGKVVTPCGTEKGFQSIYKGLDGIETLELAPGESLSHSLTLLRGADGALFAGSGLYQVSVAVEWESGRLINQVNSACHVMVTPPVDEAHAKVAARLLSTPDVHLVLILGGDHLKDGIEAIQLALKNKVLCPHYALIEAKRIGRRFLNRKADISGACKLIDKSTIFSASEARRLMEILQSEGAGKKGQAIPQEVARLLGKGQIKRKAAVTE